MIEIIEFTEKSKDTILNLISSREGMEDLEAEKTVRDIIKDVRANGDSALKKYLKLFDNVELDSLKVSEQEIEDAFKNCDKELIDILEESKKNIEFYHKEQMISGYYLEKDLGVFLGQRVLPIESVGVYVPGGTAAYPSSVLMNVIPAKVAGVKEIVMVTPPDKNGGVNKNILVAAKIAGVNTIFKVGGAQGVAALAYGTETVQKVQKIVGPGNKYVAIAKKIVFGTVGIDMIAGPSEIVVIADKNANPKYIAADLMSQAEHDVFASSILLTTSSNLANEVVAELERQSSYLERNEIIKKSLYNFGKIVVCKDMDECVTLANLIAPEHLEILTKEPLSLLDLIYNASSIFLGEYTPEPVGDYFGGTNHVLPTNGSARFSSPLSVHDYLKKSSYIHYSKEALERDGRKITKFAEVEGLTAHSNSVKVRLSDD